MEKEGDATVAVDKQVLDGDYSNEKELEDGEDIIFDKAVNKIVFGDKMKMLIVMVIIWLMQK